MILVEMIVVVITCFIACSDKLFACKQVNRCQVGIIDSMMLKILWVFWPVTVVSVSSMTLFM